MNALLSLLCTVLWSAASGQGYSNVSQADCMFDVDICLYENAIFGTFKVQWLRISGDIKASNSLEFSPTRPLKGVGDAGSYMAFNGKGDSITRNVTLKLLTPPLLSTEPFCLRFWYFIKNRDTFGMYRISGMERALLWMRPEKPAAPERAWTDAAVDVSGANQMFQIVFQGTRPETVTYSIGLDNISFTEGKYCNGTSSSLTYMVRTTSDQGLRSTAWEDMTASTTSVQRSVSAATKQGTAGTTIETIIINTTSEQRSESITPEEITAGTTSAHRPESTATKQGSVNTTSDQGLGSTAWGEITVSTTSDQRSESAAAKQGTAGTTIETIIVNTTSEQRTESTTSKLRSDSITSEEIIAKSTFGIISDKTIDRTTSQITPSGFVSHLQTSSAAPPTQRASTQIKSTTLSEHESAAIIYNINDCILNRTAVCGFRWSDGANIIVDGKSSDPFYQLDVSAGKSQQLWTPSLPRRAFPYCLGFEYKMAGDTQLAVKLDDALKNVTFSQIFLAWDHTNGWQREKISVKPPPSQFPYFMIRFEAMGSEDVNASVALRILSLEPNECASEENSTLEQTTTSQVPPGSFECHFFADFCGFYHSSQNGTFRWLSHQEGGVHTSTDYGKKGQIASLKSPDFPFSGDVCLTANISTSPYKGLDILEVNDDDSSRLLASVNTNGSVAAITIQLKVNTTVSLEFLAYNDDCPGRNQIKYIKIQAGQCDTATDLSLYNNNATCSVPVIRNTTPASTTKVTMTTQQMTTRQLQIQTADCDFENGTCGYTGIEVKPPFLYKWLWRKADNKTQPRFDWTTQSERGFFVLADSSKSLNKAEFKSPFLAAGARCLQFYLFALGEKLSQVQLILNHQAEGSSEVSRLWSSTGNRGSNWSLVSIDLPASPLNYQVIFQANKPVAPLPDANLGIDNIKFLLDPCANNESLITIKRTVPGDCTFEKFGDLCGYKNLITTDFDWMQTKESPTDFTGPDKDHTTGKGYFLLMDASLPAKNGSRFQLASPQLQQNCTMCYTFYYFMYGNETKSLSVRLVTANTSDVIWSQVGDQGEEWRRGQITINLTSAYWIQFDGIVGEGYRGDIALDDLMIQDGECGSSQLPTAECSISYVTATTTTAQQPYTTVLQQNTTTIQQRLSTSTGQDITSTTPFYSSTEQPAGTATLLSTVNVSASSSSQVSTITEQPAGTVTLLSTVNVSASASSSQVSTITEQPAGTATLLSTVNVSASSSSQVSTTDNILKTTPTPLLSFLSIEECQIERSLTCFTLKGVIRNVDVDSTTQGYEFVFMPTEGETMSILETPLIQFDDDESCLQFSYRMNSSSSNATIQIGSSSLALLSESNWTLQEVNIGMLPRTTKIQFVVIFEDTNTSADDNGVQLRGLQLTAAKCESSAAITWVPFTTPKATLTVVATQTTPKQAAADRSWLINIVTPIVAVFGAAVLITAVVLTVKHVRARRSRLYDDTISQPKYDTDATFQNVSFNNRLYE